MIYRIQIHNITHNTLMNFAKLVAAFGLMAGLTAQGAVYTYQFNSGFANSGNIPDGNLSGWSDSRTVGGMLNQITDITVKLNLAGGFNGDLYAYLTYNNVLVPLVNRVGVGTGNAFGYGDSGLNITLTASGANNIHFYQNVVGYATSIANGSNWRPDGRAISPLSSPSAFDAAGTMSFADYVNMNPNGTWTLFIADVSGGGGTPQLTSWELDITAVPEPVNVALGIFTALLAIGGWIRARRRN